MARRYWLFRQTTARYPTLESAVRDQLIAAAEDRGIEVDADSLTGEHARWLFDRRYEWVIRPAPDHYLVFENQYMSVRWFAMFGLMFALGAASILLPSPGNLVAYVGAFCSFVVVIPPVLGATPVDATVATNDDYRTHPAAPIVLALTAGLLIATLVVGLIAVTANPDYWPFTFLLALTVVALFMLYRQQRSLRRFRPEDIPHIYELVSSYLAYILLGLIPASALIAFQSQLQPHPPYGPLTYLPFAVIGLLILMVMYRLTARQRAFLYYELREGRETIARPSVRIVALVLLVGAGYGMLAVVLLFGSKYAGVLTGGPPLPRVLVVVAVLPLLYIPTGVLLQTAAFIRETVSLLVSSTPTTFETAVEIEPQIRIVETDRYIAGSYSLGIAEYIFISDALVETLERDELEAVLAHEEGHIEHGDALLSFLLPIVASSVLTGKNVMYTVFDFRAREFTADTYAARKVGPDPLKRALRTMASQTTGEDARTWASAPTFISFSSRGEIGLLDRYFGAFFGSFALTEVHPGVDERITHMGGCQRRAA